ncbi:hypothetical protein BGZ65_004826, partial [Modicella reniformis]
MNETPLQKFQAQSSSKLVSIPARHDPKSSQLVIRWRDIQQWFANAMGILNGEAVVLFLTDDDLEDLQPLRIAYHPGVILKVLTTDDNIQASSSPTEVSSSTITSEPDSSSKEHSSFTGCIPKNVTTCLDADQSSSTGPRKAITWRETHVADLKITEIDGDNQSLVLHSQASSMETQTLQHASPASTNNQHIHTVHPEIVSNNTYESQQHPLQQQIDKVLQETQHINRQMQQADQRTHQQQQQIDQAIQEFQQTKDQIHKQQQHIEETRQQQQQHIEGIQQQANQQQQHIEGIQQQTNQQQQHIKETLQQQQQQIDDILQQIQIANQHGHKMIQQMQESILLQKQESDRLMLIKYRTHALLGTSL